MHSETQINRIANSIKEFGFTQPLVVDKDNVVIIWHGRLEWAKKLWLDKVPVVVMEDLTENQIKKLRILDNKLNESEWDIDNLKLELDWLPDLNIWDLELDVADLFPDLVDDEEQWEYVNTSKWPLAERFITPPFSIWDAKQWYWLNRKRVWRELIKDNWESRENTLFSKDSQDRLALMLWRWSKAKIVSGVSILDPVLAECINRFFCIDWWTTFDPFAWDSVFWYVSWYTWHKFRWIELRKEQAELNQQRCSDAWLDCIYYNDTSENMDEYIEDNSVDMVFSCPPYWNLERYSDDPKDLSTMSKDDFYYTIKWILTNTYKKLKDDSFAVMVIWEVRDKWWEYINFVWETIKIMMDAWYKYYNEIILATPLSSAVVRAWRMFNHWRKICKIHQNVLVFYKWNIQNITKKFWEIDFSDLDFNSLITDTDEDETTYQDDESTDSSI